MHSKAPTRPIGNRDRWKRDSTPWSFCGSRYMIRIPKDFKEFLQLLNENKVDFIIVGGYAVAFHGAPRYTGDIDVYVRKARENGQKIVKALEAFGFADVSLRAEDFAEADKVFQLGVPPLRIDIVTDIDGLSWDEAASNAVEVSSEDLHFKVIGLQELIKNKKSVGRHKDLADLSALEGTEE